MYFNVIIAQIWIEIVGEALSSFIRSEKRKSLKVGIARALHDLARVQAKLSLRLKINRTKAFDALSFLELMIQLKLEHH